MSDQEPQNTNNAVTATPDHAIKLDTPSTQPTRPFWDTDKTTLLRLTVILTFASLNYIFISNSTWMVIVHVVASVITAGSIGFVVTNRLDLLVWYIWVVALVQGGVGIKDTYDVVTLDCAQVVAMSYDAAALQACGINKTFRIVAVCVSDFGCAVLVSVMVWMLVRVHKSKTNAVMDSAIVNNDVEKSDNLE